MTVRCPIRYPMRCPIRYPNADGLPDTPKSRATEQLQLQLHTQRHHNGTCNCNINYKPQRQVPSTCRSGDVILSAHVTVMALAGADSFMDEEPA